MTALIITGSIILVLVTYMIISYRKIKNIPEVEKSEKIIDLTDRNFTHQVKGKLALVDFWASWCVPCKMMAPVLNELAEEVGNDVKVCKVNVDQYQSLAGQWAVRGIPTMLLLRDGVEVDRFVGVKSKQFLIDKIVSHR